MPIPPGDLSRFSKVNYIIDSWAHPCEAPWYIYVEALWPAAFEAFIVLITFGWDDVLRGFWRPRGLGRRTGKRKGKWARRIPRFPEFGDEIGKRIPGAKHVKGRKWGAGGKALWRIDTLLQRGLFYWLVADVTLDFAYNFTSLLYSTGWCAAIQHGRFSSWDEDRELKPPGIWTLMDFPNNDYQSGTCFWTNITGYSGDKPCVVTAATSYEQWGSRDPPTEVGIRVAHADTNEIFIEHVTDTPDDPNQPGVPATGTIPAFTRFKVWSKHNAFEGAINLGGVVVGFQE